MEEARGDHVTTHQFDALANELEEMMNSTNLTMSPRCCIFKVPNILSRHNPKAYAPNAFSIGPFHYGKEHLKATQKIKLRYLHELMSRFPDRKTMLRTLTAAICEVQQEARDCYADSIDPISSDEFLKILVLDGCFLIELFRKDADEKLQKHDDPVLVTSCMRQFLCHDLTLLENQIPWLVLELLFNITRKPEDRSCNLSILVLRYCYKYMALSKSWPSDIDEVFKPFRLGEHESKHLLDVLRNSLVLCSGIREKGSVEFESMPSATRLWEAGIKLKNGTSFKSMLDIKFEDGVLEIPPLIIQGTTESLLRNLMCLEQCHPNCPPIVSSYAILLDSLINTPGDMEILCQSKIIDCWLNIDDAPEFFNELYDDTFTKEFYYSDIVAKVNEYCRHRWPRYRTVLIHDYFRHPWALVSVAAATILLILTLLQTLFAII